MKTQEKIDEIIAVLHRRKIRATYEAVSEVIGGTPLNVANYLGEPRIETCWIVSKKNGRPTNYPSTCIHKDLERLPAITSGSKLREYINRHAVN